MPNISRIQGNQARAVSSIRMWLPIFWCSIVGNMERTYQDNIREWREQPTCLDEVQGALQDPWWSQGHRLWEPSPVKHLTSNSNSHLISAKVFLQKKCLLFWKTSGLELVSFSHFLHVIYRNMFLTGYSITKWISFYDCLYFLRYSAICSL